MKATITTREQALTIIEVAEHLIGETSKAATELRERKVVALERYKEQLAKDFAEDAWFRRSEDYWAKRIANEYNDGWDSPFYHHNRTFKESWAHTYTTLESLRDRLATLINHINFALVKVGEPIHLELSHEDLILLENTIVKVDNRLNELYEGEF